MLPQIDGRHTQFRRIGLANGGSKPMPVMVIIGTRSTPCMPHKHHRCIGNDRGARFVIRGVRHSEYTTTVVSSMTFDPDWYDCSELPSIEGAG